MTKQVKQLPQDLIAGVEVPLSVRSIFHKHMNEGASSDDDQGANEDDTKELESALAESRKILASCSGNIAKLKTHLNNEESVVETFAIKVATYPKSAHGYLGTSYGAGGVTYEEELQEYQVSLGILKAQVEQHVLKSQMVMQTFITASRDFLGKVSQDNTYIDVYQARMPEFTSEEAGLKEPDHFYAFNKDMSVKDVKSLLNASVKTALDEITSLPSSYCDFSLFKKEEAERKPADDATSAATERRNVYDASK
ncbi:hypothetical protein [Candidatus Synchoanobacter obligatus]|uniref:Uncharacterized protein n=1 Tax=Candidatus Synchoanobacter obligatus TaxID=2919597 RepID=A0ABT1L815_9GAMM|nr:hypothetical protein [Candidatus Synchoanobacter obligatus]MCP8352408.1 hypothetical protein [Candidatus Synchoanobacter obligatus]